MTTDTEGDSRQRTVLSGTAASSGNDEQSSTGPAAKSVAAPNSEPQRVLRSAELLARKGDKKAKKPPPGNRPSSNKSENSKEGNREVEKYAVVAGVYAPLLRLRNKRELDEIPVVPIGARTVGGLRDQIEKTKQCNCKRSHCLKLYCECFASGIHCSSLCNCVSCKNIESKFSNYDDRNEAIVMTLERNQHAFRPRIIAIAGAAASVQGGVNNLTAVHGESTAASSSPIFNDVLASPGGAHSMTGCNCKKSFCLKKYCECFHAAVYCNPPHCRCTDCQNTEGNPERERLVAKRRSQAEAAAAAAALAHQHSRLAHMSGRMAMMGDAGRTYYSKEHPYSRGANKEKSSDVEASTAAAAMAAGAAAGGVDVFLPPSSYAVPMQLRNGTSYAALSFGTAGPRSMGQSAADVATSTQSSGLSTPSKPAENKARSQRKRQRTSMTYPPTSKETELETAWKQEVGRVTATFQAIRHQLQQQRESPITVWSNDAVSLSHLEASKREKSHEMMFSVGRDLSRLVDAWRNTEPLTIDMLDNMGRLSTERYRTASSLEQVNVKAKRSACLREQGKSAMKDKDATSEQTPGGSVNDSSQEIPSEEDQSDVSEAENSILREDFTEPGATDEGITPETSLICTETLLSDRDSVPLSDDATRELTILAAQDAALLRELAQRVRRRALAMTRERIQHITMEASENH